MRTIDKDFKNLKLDNCEMSFASGFMTALLLMAALFKMFGLIPS